MNKLLEDIVQPSEILQAAAGPQQPLMAHSAHRQPHYHGFCPYCCHPLEACCCCRPHCRREPKELLVQPTVQKEGVVISDAMEEAIMQHATQTLRMMRFDSAATKMDDTQATAKAKATKAPTVSVEPVITTIARRGVGKTFIGGGCCVHLSIEYMPENPLATASGVVAVMVIDSEATLLEWGKAVGAQSGYQIKENIITTYPGAMLAVTVANVIARVRWCEVFSC